MGRINIEIPDEIHRKVKSASALQAITLVQYINKAIEEELKELGKWDE